ncbi:glycosyltransferase family 8 protein [Backusella circina FSU 941]|nr:glycosyltransferase family 8 protein [Backusella circina FSU 941]
MTEAYVTLVATDSYSPGALVLAHRLRQLGSVKDIVCLTTPSVSSKVKEELGQVTIVHEVEELRSNDYDNLQVLGRPELDITFTKIQLWKLTQYKKVVFLDADTLPLLNVDDLFERPAFSAAPDAGWPDCFNSGVFVAEPSDAIYDALVELSEEKGSFDGGDQGLLNRFFNTWSTLPENRLPFTYNTTPTAQYGYAPAQNEFGHSISILHFIGPNKPWTYQRFSDGTVYPRGDTWHGIEHMLQIWWDTWDKHYGRISPHQLYSGMTDDQGFQTRPIVPFDETIKNAWENQDFDLEDDRRQVNPMPPLFSISIRQPEWVQQEEKRQDEAGVEGFNVSEEQEEYHSIKEHNPTEHQDEGYCDDQQQQEEHDESDKEHKTYSMIEWDPSHQEPPKTGSLTADIPDLSNFKNAWDQPASQSVWIAPLFHPEPQVMARPEYAQYDTKEYEKAQEQYHQLYHHDEISDNQDNGNHEHCKWEQQEIHHHHHHQHPESNRENEYEYKGEDQAEIFHEEYHINTEYYHQDGHHEEHSKINHQHEQNDHEVYDSQKQQEYHQHEYHHQEHYHQEHHHQEHHHQENSDNHCHYEYQDKEHHNTQDQHCHDKYEAADGITDTLKSDIPESKHRLPTANPPVFPWETNEYHLPPPTRIWMDEQQQPPLESVKPPIEEVQEQETVAMFPPVFPWETVTDHFPPPTRIWQDEQPQIHKQVYKPTTESASVMSPTEFSVDESEQKYEQSDMLSYDDEIQMEAMDEPVSDFVLDNSPSFQSKLFEFIEILKDGDDDDVSVRDLIPINFKSSSRLNSGMYTPTSGQSSRTHSRSNSASSSRRASIVSSRRSSVSRKSAMLPPPSLDITQNARPTSSKLFAGEPSMYSHKTPYTSAAVTPAIGRTPEIEKESYFDRDDEWDHPVKRDFLNTMDYSLQHSIERQKDMTRNSEWDPLNALSKLKAQSESMVLRKSLEQVLKSNPQVQDEQVELEKEPIIVQNRVPLFESVWDKTVFDPSSGVSSPRTPVAKHAPSNMSKLLEAEKTKYKQQHASFQLVQPQAAVASTLEAELDLSQGFCIHDSVMSESEQEVFEPGPPMGHQPESFATFYDWDVIEQSRQKLSQLLAGTQSPPFSPQSEAEIERLSQPLYAQEAKPFLFHTNAYQYNFGFEETPKFIVPSDLYDKDVELDPIIQFAKTKLAMLTDPTTDEITVKESIVQEKRTEAQVQSVSLAATVTDPTTDEITVKESIVQEKSTEAQVQSVSLATTVTDLAGETAAISPLAVEPTMLTTSGMDAIKVTDSEKLYDTQVDQTKNAFDYLELLDFTPEEQSVVSDSEIYQQELLLKEVIPVVEEEDNISPVELEIAFPLDSK